MKLTCGTGFSKLGGVIENMVGRDTGLAHGMSDCEVSLGFASDPAHGVPGHAAQYATFMGDKGLGGDSICSPAAEAMLKAHPENVQVKPVWNERTQKFDAKFCIAGDAGFDPLAGQVFSPWNIAYMSKIWKRPLSYSRAKEMVRTERAGNNPFAEIFTLFLEDYAGWGVIGQTGSFQNTLQNDVNVKNGMMSAPIINMMGTYSVTLEEKTRSSWGPMNGSPVARKQAYLNYVFDMMDDILIYYGNDETNTQGLLDVNPIRSWASGKSMKDLFTSTTTTTRGSDAFRIIAEQINDFLTAADNKFSSIKIAVSPEAWNYLTSMPYSDNFDATVAMHTFAKSYLAGKGPNGSTPMIEWIAEPLLKANSELNPNSYDLMVISAPEIGGGPEDEKQPTNFYATSLDKFVFPVIPGMYNDQYKTLRRVAGIFAPIPSALRVYAGFGTQG